MGILADNHLQRLIIDLELSCDLTAAGASDDLADTIDYAALASGAVEVARQSRCHLLERLGTLLADHCLALPGVMAAAVRLQKPQALADGAMASVTIRRARGVA